MSIILRRKVDKINESFLNNRLSYKNDESFNTSQMIFKLLSQLINSEISLNFNISNISGNISSLRIRSKSDISAKRLAGNLIEAFVIKYLLKNKLKIKQNINSNQSPDFIYNNVKFEIKSYCDKVSNLSLGRFDSIKNGLLTNDDNKYKDMTAIIFRYEIDNIKNKIIIKDLDVIPFIFLINKDFMLKGGGSTQVIAGNYSTNSKEDYNELIDELRNILNNKNKERDNNEK